MMRLLNQARLRLGLFSYMNYGCTKADKRFDGWWWYVGWYGTKMRGINWERNLPFGSQKQAVRYMRQQIKKGLKRQEVP